MENNKTSISEIQNFTGAYPKQLYILFFTEMWERFTYYGNRALLILYMVNVFKFDDTKANLTYGSYAAFVYAMPVLGGFIADKLLGYRKSLFFGGILMALGNLTMLIPQAWSFYLGLSIIIIGNGFFKPNISSMVGKLYKDGDNRRDAGFSLFYMGINIGAFIGSLICGYVGQTINWNLGFGLAGFFMLAGLFVFYKGQHTLGPIGETPEKTEQMEKGFAGISLEKLVYIGCFLLIPVFFVLLKNYEFTKYIMNIFGPIALIYVIYVGLKEGKEAFSKIVVALILTFFSMLFWSFYEQGGGSLNLFAERNVEMLGLSSAAVNNSVNPLWVILLSPLFGFLWIKLGKKNLEPNSPVKFAIGLLLLGLSFYIFVLASQGTANGKISLLAFVFGYFVMTCGELCLSPIGLSAITKLSPAKMVGLMMGMWFLASAFGQYLAGVIGTMMAIPSEGDAGVPMGAAQSLAIYSGVFEKIALISVASGVFLLLISPFLKKAMYGIK